MTIIATHRRPIVARLRTGLSAHMTRIAALTTRSRPARLQRPAILDLDERMLRDIGVSRSEFMAADMDG